MTESKLETERLLQARNTLKVVWTAYRRDRNLGRDTDIIEAVELSLDLIDLKLLHNTDAEISFTLEGET